MQSPKSSALCVLLILVTTLLFARLALADYISINSGGDNSFVLNPEEHIEGIFAPDDEGADAPFSSNLLQMPITGAAGGALQQYGLFAILLAILLLVIIFVLVRRRRTKRSSTDVAA